MSTASSNDPFDLLRFVSAQAGLFDQALAELRRGRKQSHWMWFVFPQIEGLGFSAMAQRYAITSLLEAQAYLAHPLLGARLRQAAEVTTSHADVSARAIFGSPDDLKFRSSMTLFRAASQEPVFTEALERFFDGAPDPLTLERIRDQT